MTQRVNKERGTESQKTGERQRFKKREKKKYDKTTSHRD